MKLMTAILFWVGTSAFTGTAYADLDHTVGTANVDTFAQSQDMQLEITGQAAQQLYEQLKVSVTSDAKVGAGIICRIDHMTINPAYVCDLDVRADGTVTK